MTTMVQPYAAPERCGVVPAMSHYYELPMFSRGGCSDSKCVDQQAGIEAALTLVTNALSGGHIVHDLGYIESALCYSLVQLAISDETLGWISQSLKGADTSDAALALDVIDEVGPVGRYLDHPYTLQHYRERRCPNLLDRENHDNWVTGGSKTMEQRVTNRVDEILAGHRPDPLSEDIGRELTSIVDQAEVAYARG